MTPPDRDSAPLFHLPGMAGVSSDRGRIIDAAANMVTADGNLELSWDKVAAASGVPLVTIHPLFPSADALLAATLTLTDARNATAYYSDANSLGWRGMDSYVRLMQAVVSQPGAIKIYSRLRWEAVDRKHAAHEWLNQHREISYETLMRAVETGVERGEMLPEIDARQVAETMLGISEGVQLQWLASKGKVTAANAMADYVALLRHRYATEGFKGE